MFTVSASAWHKLLPSHHSLTHGLVFHTSAHGCICNIEGTFYWYCVYVYLLYITYHILGTNLYHLWRFSTAWYGTVRYDSLLGGFPLGTVPGTWYFFSTTSVEVPSEPYRYQNVTCKLCWSLIGRRESSLLRHWTCDTRPSSIARPARFKPAQPAKDRTQLLFKQTHIFA